MSGTKSPASDDDQELAREEPGADAADANDEEEPVDDRDQF